MNAQARLRRREIQLPMGARSAAGTAGEDGARRPPLPGPKARGATAITALAAMGLAAGLAALLGSGSAAAIAEPELARLLRFMAGVKGALVLAALAALLWRLGHGPAPRPAALAGWVGALGLMTAGVVLIWQVAPAGPGAITFHAGLALLVATLAMLDRRGLAAALSARVRRTEP